MTQMKTEKWKEQRGQKDSNSNITPHKCYKCKWIKHSTFKGRYFQAREK